MTFVEQPVDPRGNADFAFELLRAAILDGTLEAGRTISQAWLGREFGLGRTPLREAVRRLQEEGLLASELNQRIRIAPLELTDLESLYSMRIAFESLAVRLSVPKLTAEDMRTIREYLSEFNKYSEAEDLASARAPHRGLHAHLYGHAGERLTRECNKLWDHAERYRLLYFRAQGADQIGLLRLAQQEHQAIVEAAEQREAELCSRLIAHHLARTALTLFATIDSRHDPLQVRVALQFVDPED
jgi:DNA-binding GntR family transcriptional regulator